MQFNELTNRLSPTLKKIAFKLDKHKSYFDYEDLYQEALIHLWILYNNGSFEDKTDSFILQGCYFFLKNFIKNKKNNTIQSIEDFIEKSRVGESSKNFGDGYLEYDPFKTLEDRILIIQLLSNKLTEVELEILFLISEGKAIREIGKHFGISHVSVIKKIKKIRKKVTFQNF